jgi:nucleoside-diphosphate-sugar epimerase
MKVLLLVRPGFIGNALIDHLHEHELALLSPADALAVDELPAGGQVFSGTRNDLSDRNLRARLSRWKPDVVIELGAFNQRTATQALDGLRGIAPRYVVVSSISVYRRYGAFLRLEPALDDGKGLLRETDPLRRRLFVYRQALGESTDCGRSWLAEYDKIAAEETFRRASNVGVQIVRLPLIYGPGDPDRRVQCYAERLRAGPIIMTRSQAAWRQSRCFVRDAAQAITSAAIRDDKARSFDIFNVSDGADLSEADWVELIAETLGPLSHPAYIEHSEEAQPLVSDFPSDSDYSQHLAVDSRRIRTALGWKASTEFGLALDETVRSNNQ